MNANLMNKDIFETINRGLENFLYRHGLEPIHTYYRDDIMMTAWVFENNVALHATLQEYYDIQHMLEANDPILTEAIAPKPYEVRNRNLNKFLYLHQIRPIETVHDPIEGVIWKYTHTKFLDTCVTEFRTLRKVYFDKAQGRASRQKAANAVAEK